MLNLSHRYKRNIFFSVYCFLFFYIQLSVAERTGVQSPLLFSLDSFYISRWLGNFGPAIACTAVLEFALLIITLKVHKGNRLSGGAVVAFIFLFPIWAFCAPVTCAAALLFFIVQFFRYRGKIFIDPAVFQKAADDAGVHRRIKAGCHAYNAAILLLDILFGVAGVCFTAVYDSIPSLIIGELLLLAVRVLAGRKKTAFIYHCLKESVNSHDSAQTLATLCYFILRDGNWLRTKLYHLQFSYILLEKYASAEAVRVASQLADDPIISYRLLALQILLDSYIFTSETQKISELECKFNSLYADPQKRKACPESMAVYFKAVFAYFHRDYDRARELFAQWGDMEPTPNGKPNIKQLYFMAQMDLEAGEKEKAKAELVEIINTDFDLRLVRMAKKLYEVL